MTPGAKDPNVTKNQRKNIRVYYTGKEFVAVINETRKGNLSGKFWYQFEMMKMLFSVETDLCVKKMKSKV
jgi:hypothetical protein